MTKIIDFSQKKKELNNYKAKSKHDLVLDYCDEIFPEGVILVAIVEGELEISSSIEDEETLYAAIRAAKKTVQLNIDGD